MNEAKDEHLRSDRLNFAAKAYMEAGILYLKHCKSLETREDRPRTRSTTTTSTAKTFATSGKIFVLNGCCGMKYLLLKLHLLYFCSVPASTPQKMNIIYKTIKEQGVLKKEHRKIAFEYLNYSEDFLSSQKYFDLGQHLHRTQYLHS